MRWVTAVLTSAAVLLAFAALSVFLGRWAYGWAIDRGWSKRKAIAWTALVVYGNVFSLLIWLWLRGKRVIGPPKSN